MSHHKIHSTLNPLPLGPGSGKILLFSHVYPSPVGPIYFLVTRTGGVFRSGFSDRVFQQDPQKYTIEPNKYACGEVAFQLDQYFHSDRKTFELELVTDLGTQFQQDVWNRLLKIDFGQTMTYGEIAQKVGRRFAARAVGNAVGKNPLPIFVPCHRVLPASGKVGKYSADGLSSEQQVSLKQSLLKLEWKRAGNAQKLK